MVVIFYEMIEIMGLMVLAVVAMVAVVPGGGVLSCLHQCTIQMVPNHHHCPAPALLFSVNLFAVVQLTNKLSPESRSPSQVPTQNY